MSQDHSPSGKDRTRKQNRRKGGSGPKRSGRPAPAGKGSSSGAGGNRYFLTGRHPVTAALKNPERRLARLLATQSAAEEIAGLAARRGLPIELAERDHLDRLAGADTIHQGLALEVLPLDPPGLSDLPDPVLGRPILVLDQVTDPRNVGAILRSAATFGALAVVVQDRHAPPETAVLAKAASGAMETVPLIRETNLARALKSLQDSGYWVAGLAGEADVPLAQIPADRPIALVLGAEGEGLRRLTREACDQLVHIPMAPNAVGSLNVSNAAAVALYAVTAALPG